jgi:hypothetical protein
MPGFTPKPGGSSLVQPTTSGPDLATPGKRTLTEQLSGAMFVQRSPGKQGGSANTGATGNRFHIARPQAGIDNTGFVDNSTGAPLYNTPAPAGGEVVRDTPLPPATRVFVSGTHPRLKDWWYVTAYVDQTMVRGYLEAFRVNIKLPEPFAELRQLYGGEKPEILAKEKFGNDVVEDHDLRYYENVLLYVNQGRDGIQGKYQDPGVLRRGNNNIKLIAGHRIWLVSPGYAKTLESIVPSGSLTGGAVAKAKRFGVHLEDILHSVTESPHHFGEVAGQYAQAIRDHLLPIIGITAGFITAEAISMFLAAAPTGVSQIIAVLIQLALSAFGAAGMVMAGVEALQHGTAWLTTAWTAHGRPDVIAEASREFLRMLVAIAVAALSYTGAKANYGNALAVANKVPTGALPALATASSPMKGGAQATTGVSIGPSTVGPAAAGNVALRLRDKDNGESGSLFDSRGDESSVIDEPELEAAATHERDPNREMDPRMASENGVGVLHSARLGIQRPPFHHLLPQEKLGFFQARGFPGREIDNFCVRLTELQHEIVHGGNQSLARRHWPEHEWNTAVMKALEEQEAELGRRLRRNEILRTVEKLRVEFKIANRPIVRYRR